MLEKLLRKDQFKSFRTEISMLTSDLCGFNDVYFVEKGGITVGAPNNAKKKKQQHLKAMHHLSTAFQK